MIPRITITVVASLPIFNSFFSDSLGFNFLYISIVNIVEHELNTHASELISAAIRPPATNPFNPTGSKVLTSIGNALSAFSIENTSGF